MASYYARLRKKGDNDTSIGVRDGVVRAPCRSEVVAFRCCTWPWRRREEWSRHLGASLSMRIIASWFGSCRPTEYKYASVIIRQWRAPLGIETYDDRLISVGVFLS